jgi:hypothetical protein
MNTLSFNDILEAINLMPLQDQEIIANTVNKRIIENRRKEIAINAEEAKRLFLENKLPIGSSEDLEKDLLGE